MVDLKYYRKWAKQHPNFMTPHIKSLKDYDVYVIELSEGTDFNHKPIYGVTLLKMQGSQFITTWENKKDVNKMFYNLKDARSHIKTVIQPYIKELQYE